MHEDDFEALKQTLAQAEHLSAPDLVRYKVDTLVQGLVVDTYLLGEGFASQDEAIRAAIDMMQYYVWVNVTPASAEEIDSLPE